MGFNGEEYSLLKDLNLEFKGEEHRAFSLCFWLYLTNSSSSPSTILRQVNSDVKFNAPFLALNERKKMMLFPLIFLHQEAPNPVLSAPWSEAPYALSNVEFPLDKWVHVGCEVSADFVRLHIDEEIVAEKPLTSLLNVNANSDGLRTVSLVGTDGDSGEIKGYVHGVDVLPLTSSIKNHHVKDPPLKLSIDSSSTSEIEEDSDGVLCIVGGKASCRRNFSLDVILSDAFDQPVNKELEVVASLIYADNEAPVEKPNDAEAPLLTSYDGIEFASSDRPSKLMNGRASFRLKISQLSSKCDNRLFRIKFDIPKMGRHPFLEAISLPIRCISRNRTSKTSFPMFKRSSSLINLPNGSQSSGFDDGSSELLQNIVHEARPSPLSKRVKLGQEKTFMDLKSDFMRERADEECNSHAWTANEVEIKRNSQDDKSNGKSFDGRSGGHKEIVDYSDSDSSEATNSDSKSVPSNKTLISDLVVFKYCLGSLTERSLLLKDIATSSSEEELFDFAEQVSLYSGCSHHRQQIRIAKRLVEEGIKAWKMISQNNYHVLWERLVPEIKEHFLKIACCNSRSLTHQDIELLRRIAGCQELVTQENFEKLWCWLYPVAFALSQDLLNSMWESSPKWIEGLITKEEAESSLQGSGGFRDPGTFVLRFPTSRSWPHPDSGNLVVTYIGSDYAIHHRLLSLDFVSGSYSEEMTGKTLQDMLLEEPELSRLGRTIRSH